MASAIPIIKRTESRVEVTVRLAAGMVTGQTNDAVLKVGDKPVKLSAIRKIDFKPKPIVQMADGKTLEGPIVGLGAIEISLGEEKIKIDATKAIQLAVQPIAEASTVAASVVARVDGTDIARIDSLMTIRDFARSATADPASVPIVPPPLGADKVVKRLPEVFNDVAVGGNGRYPHFPTTETEKTRGLRYQRGSWHHKVHSPGRG